MAADWEIQVNGTQLFLMNAKYMEYLYTAAFTYDAAKRKVFCWRRASDFVGNPGMWNFTDV